MTNPSSEMVTSVFVDYEAWFWGLYNNHGETPDIRGLIQDIKQRGKLKEICFFGDFTKPEMAREKPKLRTVTNQIIDCSTADEKQKKNYTDFIMLDHIYRSVLQDAEEINQYILVTGDGHFHSVVAYLATFMDKIVGIYAVQGSLSPQLKDCASWNVELQPKKGLTDYQQYVLLNIHYAEEKPGIIPTFSGTVSGTAKYYKVDRLKCSAALSKLISEGYIHQEIRTLADGRGIQALVTDWDLLTDKGIWKPELVDELTAELASLQG